MESTTKKIHGGPELKKLQNMLIYLQMYRFLGDEKICLDTLYRFRGFRKSLSELNYYISSASLLVNKPKDRAMQLKYAAEQAHYLLMLIEHLSREDVGCAEKYRRLANVVFRMIRKIDLIIMHITG